MKLLQLFFIFIVCLLLSKNAFSGSRYWIGGTGNWNTPSNWASSSGGVTDNILPTSSDYVYFDANSGNGTVTANTDITISYLYFYTGCSNITLNITANTLTVTNYYYHYTSATNAVTQISGGTLTAGNIDLYAGNFYANSGTINTITSYFFIEGANVYFNGTTVNVGNSTNEYLRLYSGTLDVTAGTVNVTNYFYVDNSGFTMSGGTINVGTGLSLSYWATVYINGTNSISGGTINVQAVQANQYATYIYAGTSVSGGLVKITASNANYSFRSSNFYNLEIDSPGRTSTLAYNMNFYGNLTVTNGTLTYTSTYGATFVGSSPQSITGTSPTAITFYNLTLNNASGLVISPTNGIATTVRNTLTLTNGKITLGNSTLNIGTTGVSGNITGGSSSNYIITNGTGVLKQYNVGTGQRTSVFYPIGISSTSYTPITLAVSGASTVDDFSVRVSQNVLINGTSGSAYTDDCVDRTWNISEGTAGGSSVTISPQWNGSEEFASFIRSTAYIGHYTGGVWTTVTTGTVTGSNPYTCTSAAITSFSPFAVFDPILLPNDEVTFEVVPNGNKVDISWTTTTEVNCDYYTIKKSSDGIHFVDVDEVEQTGNPYVSKQYYSLDEQPFLGISYYQLNQFDTDGNIIYSSIKSVNFKNQQNSILYPNPVSDGVIHLSLNEFKGNLEISIFDNGGKLVYYQTAKDKENSIITIDLNDEFSNGIYQVQISNEHIIEHHKLYVH